MQQAQLFMDMIGRYPVLGEATNIPILVSEIAKLFHFRNQDIAKPMAQYLAEQEQKKQQEQQAAQQQQQGGPSMGGMSEPGAGMMEGMA